MLLRIFIVIGVMTLVEVSCCGPFETQRFRVDGFDVSLVRLVDAAGNNAPYFHPDSLAIDSIAGEKFGFFIAPVITYIAARGSLLPAAVACSPTEPEPVNRLVRIIITSGEDIEIGGMTYAAGDNIADAVDFHDNISRPIQQTIDHYLMPLPHGFFVRFHAAPVVKKEYTFTFKFELQGGTTFEVSTVPIVIL